MYDAIIIGAGPAGISAALYGASRGMKLLILEKDQKIGGTLRNVSNVTHFAGFPSAHNSEELLSIWEEQIKGIDVDVIHCEVTSMKLQGKVKYVICNDISYATKTIIIAAGTTQNTPDFQIEESLMNLHVHNNAQKYVNNYKNAVVIGGSDGAAKEALYLANHLDHVDLIVLEKKLSCVKEFSTQIDSQKNISVHLDSEIITVKGSKKIESIEFKSYDKSQTTKLNIEDVGIFYYIGSYPNTQIAKELDLNTGFIEVDEDMQTAIEGVYAVGDIRVKNVRQISTAISDGANAAIDAFKYCNQ